MTRSGLTAAALVLAAALAVVPFVLPTGADAGIDASGLLESGRFLVAAGAIFLGGLLTSLTPCVYPLIPITVSVFGARRAESRGRAVVLTSAYVIGMGLVFSVLGVAAALSGKAFGSALGSPWVATGLAVFLLILASSMFGAFELALPSGVATKLNTVGGGGLVGAALMGSVSGFIAAPCTGPVLAGVLAFVAKSQNALLGGALLFIYALGIGVPFFLIGAFTVRLPKGGVWMEWVKSVFGIALVALAASYLRDGFVPLREGMAELAALLGRWGGILLASLLVFGGVLLGAIHRSFKEGVGQRVLKGSGVFALTSALLIRGAAMNAPPVGTLAEQLGFAQPAEQHGVAWDMVFPPKTALIASVGPFEDELKRAKSSGKPVMIDFFAEWCEACKELDRDTYVAREVLAEASRFVSIKVDATNSDDAIETLFQRFGVQGLPTVAFIDSRGQILTDPRITGFLGPEKFVLELKKVR
ncbi:MAG: protein-disulfide reductase DsbD family protein [Myxococcota bacterium]